jgi:hypothetical protein
MSRVSDLVNERIDETGESYLEALRWVRAHVTKEGTCPMCKGDGRGEPCGPVLGKSYEECPACGGTGYERYALG